MEREESSPGEPSPRDHPPSKSSEGGGAADREDDEWVASEVSMGQAWLENRAPVQLLNCCRALVTADRAVLPRTSSQLMGGAPEPAHTWASSTASGSSEGTAPWP